MAFRSRTHTNPTRRGAVTVWVLVGLIVIVGIVAIGMDGGRMLEKRRQCQAVADAAALAGAASVFHLDITGNAYNYSLKLSAAQSAGLSLAAANGFNNDGITSTVTINYHPNSGAFAGQVNFVEAIVQYNLPKSFGGIFTNNNLPVSARAVAVGRPVQIGIIALQQSGANAFQFNAKGNMTVNSGAVFVNSNDAAAFAVTDSGTVSADNYSVTGNYTKSSGTIYGQVYTNMQRTPDPLLSLAVPNSGSLSVQSSSPMVINSGSTTLGPGVYKGGINIGGTATVSLQPGVYVMQGGGFQVGGGANVTGTTPLIYNTTGTAAPGPISINTSGAFTFSAYTTGAYQGVSFFQDRSQTQTVTITGNGNTHIGGAVYAPAAPINLAGNYTTGSDTLGTAYICATMQVTGLGNITIDTTINPLIVPQVTLVE